MRIFPLPKDDDAGGKIYFHYYKRDDRNDVTQTQTTGKVSDPSNIPYKFITYTNINSMGRNWIRKYTLALAKEMLGSIRGKYQSLPIPGSESTLDYTRLLSEAATEKEALIAASATWPEGVTQCCECAGIVIGAQRADR